MRHDEYNTRIIANAPKMLNHLKYIEHAISAYELASIDDDEVIQISITGKVAKDIVETIVDIVAP